MKAIDHTQDPEIQREYLLKLKYIRTLGEKTKTFGKEITATSLRSMKDR